MRESNESRHWLIVRSYFPEEAVPPATNNGSARPYRPRELIVQEADIPICRFLNRRLSYSRKFVPLFGLKHV